jgi:DNA-binding transcriptional LysR family regulator
MVELGIRELQYHQQVQELLNQRIDIGYVPIRFPELESELVFECVRKAPFLVALPTEHPLAKQRRLRRMRNLFLFDGQPLRIIAGS